ncbi:hypothetical protein MACJ_000950 [Theileria orientalis]|uniref:PH domain-containing protein n=1 Tax=Theileria orientalis TaxID=68886 RepID=A0A976M4Z4_THEOR|nr:hypothetical protein MACJ_000950 [Theileria orientalis]
MVGVVSDTIGLSKLNLDTNINGQELPFFFNNPDETGTKVPQLTEAVIHSFGKILDIFEEPLKLRDPEFDHSHSVPHENSTSKANNGKPEFGENGFRKPLFNLEYLGKRTRQYYDKVESHQVPPPIEVNEEMLKVSASPCPENIHLCGKCFVSLASVRCDTCMVYFCGMCASNVHSDVLYKSHTLFTTKSDRPAHFATGVHEGVDLSISLNKEASYPEYEWCESHPKQEVKYACVTCHFTPVCGLCASEFHKAPGSNHKVIEIELAVTEVKEFLNDCLSGLVDRHNGLSPVLPELDQLSHMAEVSVSSSTRSLRCSLQGVFDALKTKQMLIDGEINILQQLGSSNLNRLSNVSANYNKYLLSKIEQLKRLSNMKDPGLALNLYVELRQNFEQLLYHYEDIPDLALEIPHWQLNTGNLPNLLADVEYRINNRSEELNDLCTLIVEQANIAASSVEYVLSSDVTYEDEPELFPVENPVEEDPNDMTELRGVFTRKDYVHRIPCKRAVTLREHFLYVYTSDSHFEGSSVESKIDLSAVTVKSFDEEELTEVAKLVRVGSPNGFELVERRGGKIRFWIFTTESRNLALLWTSKLKKIASEHFKINLSHFNIDKNFVLPVPPKLPQQFKTNRMHENEAVRAGALRLNFPQDRNQTQYVEPTPDFKHVSEALKNIRDNSSLLYDKCFAKRNELSPKNVEPMKTKLEVVESAEHKAQLPDTLSETSSIISAGRYELPTPRIEERVINIKRQPVSFRCVDLPEFEYSPQITSPKSIHKYFEEISKS